MKYILDTNIIIYFLKGQYPSIDEHLRHVAPTDVVIPSVVMAELEFGARNSRDYETTIDSVRKFTDVFEHRDFSFDAAVEYGQLRTALQKAGTPIGANDMLIAAIAMADDAILVTHNTGEFSRLDGLHTEDWTA